jgi:dihydrofolate synthase/folylpolyglutamate synthase
VVPQPLVTLLTSIGFDHTAILGATLPLIAAEKAAIIKAGVPAVASPQCADVVNVFEEQARLMHAPLLLGDRDWHVTAVSTGAEGTGFDLVLDINEDDDDGVMREILSHRNAARPPVTEFRALRTPLRGVFQAWNAGTAAVAALVLSGRLTRIDEEAIRRGLAATIWPGRLQTISARPTVVVDGAHTPESAAALAGAMTQLYPGRPIVLVCGVQADKDIPGIAAPLAAVVTRVVATAAHHRRAANPAVIAGAFRNAGHSDVLLAAGPMAALALAKEAAGSAGVVLVAGSLYLVGEIMAGTGTDPWERVDRA